jgi:hypothetical protein
MLKVHSDRLNPTVFIWRATLVGVQESCDESRFSTDPELLC